MGMHDTDIMMEPVREIACTSCNHLLDVSGLMPFTDIACPECGTAQVVPSKLGNFLLLGLLGKGGMGAVYRSLDTSLDRPVAIKVMLTSLGENKEFVETFRREAQAAAALNHPNIVQTYSFGVAHGQPYIVMELLDGGRFDQMIAGGEPLNESLVMKIGADVAEGLNAAAGIGLVHGDVKPENILLDSNGVAKVVDFGLARFKKSREPSVEGIWGTPYYIAPEKIRGQPADARADIYSLGATLYHALAAKPPFDGETPLDVIKARLKAPAAALRTIRPDIHPEVEAIIARTLEAEPIKRYPTYVSLLSDMRNILATLKPAPNAFGQVGKRGGRIVLTRKKGSQASKLTVTGMESVVSMPTDLTATEAPPSTPRVRRKRILLGSLGAVGVIVLGGLITWGFLHYEAEAERRQALEAEQAAVKALRGSVDKTWNDMVGTISNAVKHVNRLKPLLTDAEMARTAISQLSSNLTDDALAAEAASNAPALFEAVTLAATTELLAGIDDLRAVTNVAATNLIAVLAATNVPQAEAVLTTMTNLLPGIAAGEQRVARAAETAQAALNELLAFKKKIAEAAEQQAAEAQRLSAQKAEEAKLAREKAAADKRAKEQADLAAKDLASIEDVRKSNTALVQQCRFKEAADAMAALEKTVTSDDGRAALKIAAERYSLILDLKALVVAGIQKDAKANPSGFKYGWLVNGVPSADVLGADDAKIQLKGRAVTWDQVSPAQLLRFLKRYAEDAELGRKDLARYALATAVYSMEAGGGSDGAQKMATKYRDQAVARDATLADKAKRLLPDAPASP
jgi:serine/threonine-protein kinase